MANKDGGPAFPMPYTTENNGPAGMSLRGYFAAHSICTFGAEPHAPYYAAATGVPMPEGKNWRAWEQFWADVEAKLRYQHADAMLKAREQ